MVTAEQELKFEAPLSVLDNPDHFPLVLTEDDIPVAGLNKSHYWLQQYNTYCQFGRRQPLVWPRLPELYWQKNAAVVNDISTNWRKSREISNFKTSALSCLRLDKVRKCNRRNKYISQVFLNPLNFINILKKWRQIQK